MSEEIVMALCPRCEGERECTLLFHTERNWSDDEVPLWGWDRHETIQCRGCKTVFFRHLSRFSEDWDGEEDGPLRIKHYPEVERKNLSSRFDILFELSVSKKLHSLIQEIYGALNNNLPWLAAMGIRALVELLAEELTAKKFARTVDCVNCMVDEGWISKRQSETIDAAVELGHSAIHRGHAPKNEHVRLALDILESIIELAIVSKEKAEDIKKTVPPRVKSTG